MIVGITGNREKPELPAVLERVVKVLRARHVGYVVDRTLRPVLSGHVLREHFPSGSFRPPDALRRTNLLISLGGDGTMLQAARLVRREEIPILGVNLGKLGFLAEVRIDEVEVCLDQVLSGDYRVEDRLMLEAHGKGLGNGYAALNDIVLDLSESARVMHVETWVDGDYLATFTGDGMIVSTPTGSTAYALSNGGPILPPQTGAIMVSPICPHTLTARPVVLPDSSIVTLKVKSAPARLVLTADGQPSAFLKPPVLIEVRKSQYVTKLVKRKGSKYFDVLRGKLQWGRDVRTDPE